MVFAQSMTLMNQAEHEMAGLTGMAPNITPIPPAPIPPIHYNNQNVSISNSNVGVLNLGSAKDIQVEMKTMVEQGNVALADALSAMTNAVLHDEAADIAARNELLDLIAALSQQANAKPEGRKLGTIKAIFGAAQAGAAAVQGAAGAWGALEPLLKVHFGL
ncbi:hypothetical protein [Sphingobium chungbukense]|uniref:Uncharacterized protein n=1 Tax=Sphingobium chungbukense TaxID=56193 RepID=A0A0M3AH98_9SPHN|nr:hypothetical protein [Sphingobium chungbukense]KKW89403.1 hypothetical protein YP76_25330 [Sphingobium chungbukense]